MALGSIVTGATAIQNYGGAYAVPGSLFGDWVTVHDNLVATAATSTVLKTLLTNASSNVHYARVPPGATRCLVRARYDIGVTALSTQPVVQLYTIWDPDGKLKTGNDSAPAFANDGTVRWKRIDATTIAGTALTVTCAPSTDSLDATYGYSDAFGSGNTTSDVGYDLLGGAYFAALVKTAAVVSGGAGTLTLQALFLN